MGRRTFRTIAEVRYRVFDCIEVFDNQNGVDLLPHNGRHRSSSCIVIILSNMFIPIAPDEGVGGGLFDFNNMQIQAIVSY